jgi:hypothetical protein
VTHDAEPFRQAGPEAWKRFERVVASFHTAKRPEHAAVIQEIPYDLMIVDEAHHLRNARTVLWQFVNRLARTYLLLLTATPVQNDLEELFNLVTLLQPGQLKTVRAFRREHVARGDKRQPRDPEGLRRLLAEVMVRNRRAAMHVTLPRRIARTVVLEPTGQEQALYAELSDFLREGCRRGGEITRMLARPRARILIESSTDSEWVARCLEGLGHEVIVADPNFGPMDATRHRNVKTDRRDARALAEACVLGGVPAGPSGVGCAAPRPGAARSPGGSGPDPHAVQRRDSGAAAAGWLAGRDGERGGV